MGERAPLGSRKNWFGDERSGARRLAVSTHADEGVAVLSVWHHDVCAATFRLRLDDTPQLIAALAEAFTERRPDAPFRRIT